MAADRAPFVAIRTDIRKDERVSVIADVAGYNRHEAMGRLLDMWAWCSDRKLEDAPDDCDGYALSDAVLRRFLGPRGVEAILGDGCDALALGVRRTDGLVYLRGTSDTVARLRGYRRTAVAGGESRVGAPRDEGGHFVRQTTIVQQHGQPDTSCSPAAHQPSSSSSPAVTSEYPRSQIPDPRSERERERGAPSAAPAPPLALVPAGKPKRAKSPPCDASEGERRVATAVLDRLSEASGVQFRGADPHVKLIASRLREGVTEGQLRAVVAYCADEWKGDEKMHQHLCPETLFGPVKIHKYLPPASARYAKAIAELDGKQAHGASS